MTDARRARFLWPALPSRLAIACLVLLAAPPSQAQEAPETIVSHGISALPRYEPWLVKGYVAGSALRPSITGRW